MKKKSFFTWLLILLGITALLYYSGFIPKEVFGSSNDAALANIEQKNIYLALEPPFIVNFSHQGTLRYLQVSLEVMYRNQEIIDAITEHMPAVRNDLILLFSDQKYEKLSTLAGKELLREEILAAINKQIRVNEDSGDTGQVYITNFVMQ